MEDLEDHADEIRKMEEKREHNPEFKKHMEDTCKQFNSPEWKIQQKKIKTEIENLKKNGEILRMFIYNLRHQ